MIKSEIIAISASALGMRLPNARKKTDFQSNEYLRSYSMATTSMMKVVKHFLCICKHKSSGTL